MKRLLRVGIIDRIAAAGLNVAGLDSSGEVRIVELPNHPFFVATLSLPQLSSGPGAPHPLVVAYLKAAVAFQERRTSAFWQSNNC